MITLHSHQAFDLSVYQFKHWELPKHKHQFFELTYIIEGRGKHIINDSEFSYKEGCLFLLTPDDSHTFEIEEETKFCIIVISEIYFSGKTLSGEKGVDLVEFFRRLEFIFLNHNQIQAEPIQNEADRKWVGALMNRLIQEVEIKSFLHEVVVQNIVLLLLNQVARSIQENNEINFKIKNPTNGVYNIISYIQQYIYENEKLRIENIADAFCKSKSYISQYFKEQTGESIKEYILGYKINLVKSRLLHSNMTISQIAAELGFTDESHLNKLFKERVGMTAKEFKVRNKGVPPLLVEV